MHTYARVSGVKALPVFGRSVNPILTRGGGGADYACQIPTYWTHTLLDLFPPPLMQACRKGRGSCPPMIWRTAFLDSQGNPLQ